MPETPRISCKPTENGTVSIAFIEDGKGRFVRMPAQDAVNLAAKIMAAAKQATPPPNRLLRKPSSLAGIGGVVPSLTALGSGLSEHDVSLVLHFGSSRIGFPIERDDALRLGQALLAWASPPAGSS